jgi:hypothetical protein
VAGGLPLEARVRDDSEELNFDRRAPLSLRFEAASAEDERPNTHYAAPIPADDPGPPPPVPLTRVKAAGAPAATVIARQEQRKDAKPDLAKPDLAKPDVKTNGVGPARRDQAMPHPAPAADLPGQGGESLKPDRSARGWMILLFLLVIGAALAFVGMK